MKRIFAYILLFIHINTMMFVPVADEKDVYDAYGRQIGDINTVFDFVDQVLLGNSNVVIEDEDDDMAHYFTGSYGITCYLHQQEQFTITRKEPTARELAVAYPLLPVQKPLTMAYDILTPPPEA
ncbi:hypothetical protein [Chitinophaga tropicalis]|uniref:Uncharacterized protein n=1 Tax=Chitinophaga tropicalis TaxID=2683588 RepID=A0A7K1U169_9BACT|nr:hypothetical protein [Chitinophaga tropicalis]MVT08117.1 hypothetical protein [Chitinophaga tropicalis]